VNRDVVEEWIDRLSHTGRLTIGDTDASSLTTAHGFVDEQGHQRATDPWLMRWLSQSDVFDPRLGTSVPAAASVKTLDVELWRALALDEPTTMKIGAGPMHSSQPAMGAIEAWTECELSALHALWHLEARGLANGQCAGQRHSLRVARWHVDNTQPDNATNLPWAIHVFVALAAIEADAEAGLYAQTQLHNCQISMGRPDRRSALILADAARALRDFQATG
jgi:hypothetical protein